MTRIEESVAIKSPVEKVFAYTTNAENWPKWQSILPTAEQTSPGLVGVGATFQGKVHMMGLTMKWTAQATEYEPAVRFGENITSAGMIVRQHNTYHPVDGGVRFAIAYDMTVRGLFKVFSPMLASTMRRELKKSLGNLKNVLETQA
jgi:ligand-binding SRPBCC domain-containing protein